jgi:hypothetical protein
MSLSGFVPAPLYREARSSTICTKPAVQPFSYLRLITIGLRVFNLGSGLGPGGLASFSSRFDFATSKQNP